MKRATRRFMDAFAAQLGKSAAHGVVAIMAMIALALVR